MPERLGQLADGEVTQHKDHSTMMRICRCKSLCAAAELAGAMSAMQLLLKPSDGAVIQQCWGHVQLSRLGSPCRLQLFTTTLQLSSLKSGAHQRWIDAEVVLQPPRCQASWQPSKCNGHTTVASSRGLTEGVN
jgi:hypothetical protein